MNYYIKSIVFAGFMLGLVGINPAIALSGTPKTAADYAQIIKIARITGDKRGAAIALEKLGLIYQGQSDFSQTHTNFQASLKIWRELQDRQMEGSLLLSLGDFYGSWSGNCGRAIEHYELSLPIMRELKNRTGEGVALGGIGRCHEETRESKKAIEYLTQSLTIAREVGNRRNEGIALTNLAKSYQSLDEITNNRWHNGLLATDFRQAPQSIVEATKALDYAQAGLEIAHEVNNRWGEALAFQTLGRTYAVLQDYEKAIESQQQRLLIAREFQDLTTVAETSSALGQLYTARGDYATAITHHQVAIAIYQQRQQDHDARMKQLNISTASRSAFFWLRYALMYRGDTYERQGDYAKAIHSYEAAFGPPSVISKGSGSIDITLLRRLGYTWAKWDKLPEAAATLRTAIDQEEIFRTGLGYGISSTGRDATDAERIRMAAAQAEDYRQLQQVLVRQNRTDAALEIAEEARARTFVELLSARISGRPLGKDLPAAPKLDSIRRIAKTQNATLVQYAIASPELLYIWVIKPTGEILFRSTKLDAKVSLNQLVRNTRGSIGVRSRGAAKAPSIDSNSSELKQLYQRLIAPIVADLPKDPNDQVIFLPQGPLFLVPFAALQDPQGKYLIQQHAIATAPSIQTLELTHAKPKLAKTGKPLVVGDPTMPIFEGEQLAALPGARQEAIDIAKILDTQAMIGDQGTKAAVLAQMPTASIIHLATHGLLDTIKGDIPGAIALAPNAPDSGFLSSSDIFDLKLNADLVVLSACDTGRGDITGDGVVGLSRSFIAAGVPSIVVSLWAVSDRSTNVLMSDFYKNLKTNPNKAQSLRKAMLTTMQQYPNPSDWAAFTLIGESDR
jgi:CHAT domain-containing protein